MNKISFTFCFLFMFVFSMFSYANSPNSLRWEGDFFIKEENHYRFGKSISINRKYSLHPTSLHFALQGHLFKYEFACGAGIQERISFIERGTSNYYVENVSIKGNDSLRFSALINDKKLIKKLIFSNGFNVYGYGDNKNGEMSLRDLIPFLDKHKDIITKCKNEFNQSVEKEKKEKKKEKVILWSTYIIVGIIGLILFIFVSKYLIPKFKIAKCKTKELGVAVVKNISDRKNKKFEREVEKKIIESAVDEIIRETIRQAMSEGIDPSEIIICSKCKGSGCNNCLEKGWIIEK